MNEHEIERIAAAIHHARPDWPAKSLRTLIASKLADRPRRDVFVALAWVACESATATPARVLEAGPWWRAAAADGETGTRNVPARERCNDCGKSEHHPIHANDHPFERVRRTEGDPTAEVQHLRGLIHTATATTCSHGANCRVCEPESDDQVNRLADEFCTARWSHLPDSDECDPLTRSSMRIAIAAMLESDQTLAEVLFEADRATSAAGNTFGATLADDLCCRVYHTMADAVTAHLAAILGDPETVEAVVRAITALARETSWREQTPRDHARAAIAVIGARIGVDHG